MIAAAVSRCSPNRSRRSSNGRAGARPQMQPAPQLRPSLTLKLPVLSQTHLLAHRLPTDQRAHSTACHNSRTTLAALKSP
jgi:hypothetical protein